MEKSLDEKIEEAERLWRMAKDFEEKVGIYSCTHCGAEIDMKIPFCPKCNKNWWK